MAVFFAAWKADTSVRGFAVLGAIFFLPSVQWPAEVQVANTIQDLLPRQGWQQYSLRARACSCPESLRRAIADMPAYPIFWSFVVRHCRGFGPWFDASSVLRAWHNEWCPKCLTVPLALIRSNSFHFSFFQFYPLKIILGVDMYVMWPDRFFPMFSSSLWVWNGLPDPETINIHHKCYGNIISDPSRWTIPNYTEEKISPSTKISMICVDTNG